MVSLQALTLFVYALSRNAPLALGLPFVVMVTRAAEHGVVYPIWLMGTPHTYGAVGLSLMVLVAALFGAGAYRIGGLLLGFVPAVHPSLGVLALARVSDCVPGGLACACQGVSPCVPVFCRRVSHHGSQPRRAAVVGVRAYRRSIRLRPPRISRPLPSSGMPIVSRWIFGMTASRSTVMRCCWRCRGSSCFAAACPFRVVSPSYRRHLCCGRRRVRAAVMASTRKAAVVAAPADAGAAPEFRRIRVCRARHEPGSLSCLVRQAPGWRPDRPDDRGGTADQPAKHVVGTGARRRAPAIAAPPNQLHVLELATIGLFVLALIEWGRARRSPREQSRTAWAAGSRAQPSWRCLRRPPSCPGLFAGVHRWSIARTMSCSRLRPKILATG